MHTKISRTSVPVDGSPVAFDLLSGKKAPTGGDLTVRLVRDPIHIQRGQRFAWKAVFEVPSGGLVGIGEEFPNEAPVAGYQENLVMDMPVDSQTWQSSATRSFYVRSRGGQNHARVTVRITADYEPPPSALTLDAHVNPSGSRNLEYDESKAAAQ